MRALRIAALAVLAASLLLNAVIHFRLAAAFDGVPGTIASQGDLFRVQAVVNILVVPVVAFVRRIWADAAAIAIALGGAALIIITALVPLDLTWVGLPYLFEPAYYPDKTTALLAQLVAAVAGGALLVLRRRSAGAPSRAVSARGTAPTDNGSA